MENDESNPLMAFAEGAQDVEPSNDETARWRRWVPFVSEFWIYHFGTDMQIASWLFLISSALWMAVEAYLVAEVRTFSCLRIMLILAALLSLSHPILG